MLVTVAPDTGPDPVGAALRLTVHLNALTWAPAHGTAAASLDVAARTVAGRDSTHHVVDTDSLLGLSPWHANDLADALAAALPHEPEGWVLVLPRPGHLAGLRGPVATNTAALDAGAAVLARTAEVAWVPVVVGPTVQWMLHPATPPLGLPDPTEAERSLTEALLSATRALTDLDVSGGSRPDLVSPPRLPKPYDVRRQRALDRAWYLHQVVTVALDDDGGALSSYETLQRRQHLSGLLGPVHDVISATCSAPPRRSGATMGS